MLKQVLLLTLLSIIIIIKIIIFLFLESTLLMLEDEKIVTIVTAASSEHMSSGINFPYKLRLPASESYDGIVLQKLIHDHFQYNKVAIFFTADTNSVQNTDNFLKIRKGRHFDVLTEHELDADDDDYSEAIQEAKDSGATVFAFFMDAIPCVKLLTQGHQLGLFKENDGKIIFTIEKCSGFELIDVINHNFTEFKSQIPHFMKGIIGIRYEPLHPIQYSASGQNFWTAFQGRARTDTCGQSYTTNQWTGTTNITKVGLATDNNDNANHNNKKFLYKLDSSSQTCKGLDYSAYNIDNLYKFAPFVYDGIKLLEKIYYKLLIEDGLQLSSVDATDMMTTAFNLPVYEGVTGKIKLFDGTEEDGIKYNGLYGYGDREIGHMFSIMNFNQKANTFVSIGHLDNEGNYQFCDDQVKDTLQGISINCDYYVEYNTPDNSRPSDTKPDVFLIASESIQAFLYAFGAIGLIYVAAISAVLFYRRNSKLAKASQPQMMAVTLIGLMLTFMRVIFGGEHPSPDSCMAQFWLGHLAYVIVFGG